MLRRCVIVLLFVVTTQGIYDPTDDEVTTKNQLRFHHNYSKVRIQRPSAIPNNERQTKIENARELIRTKRNKTRIEIYSKCPKGATGQFVFELSCNQYLNCWKGRGFVQNCAPGTLFNPKTLECDFAEKVQCVTGPRKSILLRHYEELTEDTQPGCPKEFSGIIPHYTDCSKFINCDRGKENVMDCAPGTLFDVNTNNCDYPHKAQCVKGLYKRPGQNSEGDQNTYNGRDQRFSSSEPIRANYQSHSGSQNFGQGTRSTYEQTRYDQNRLESDQQRLNPFQNDRSSYQVRYEQYPEQEYRRPVGPTQQPFSRGYGQEGYDQNLETSRGQQYRPFPTGQSLSRGFGQEENLQSDNQRYKPTDQPFSSGYEQEQFDQNLDGSSGGLTEQRGYRPLHQNYAQAGFGRQNVATSGSQDSRSFSSYARGHQINAQRPVKTNYDQDTQSLNHYKSQDQQESPKCPENGAGLYAHPYDCSKFLNCANGITYIQDCAPGTLFNPVLKVCDFPYNVRCQRNASIDDYGRQSVTNAPSRRPEITYADHQNRRPVQNWKFGSTRRPTSYQTSSIPPVDYYDEPQNKNYQSRPGRNWQFDRNHVPADTTRKTVSVPTSEYPQTELDDYGQTVYLRQNKNYEHRPGQDVSSTTADQWIPLEASTTEKPSGFWLTAKPDESPRHNNLHESPDVDYVYEYDDDIIIDAQPASSKKQQTTICRSGQYTCPNNHCIPNQAICDGFQDCSNDESNCDLDKFASTRNHKLAVAEKKKIANTTTTACAKFCLDEVGFQCRAFNYRKHDGVCYLLDRNIGLSGALIIYQIFDYYELTSLTVNCSNLFKCPNNKCMPYSRLCDGQNDCGDRTDEKHCSAQILGYSIRLSGSPNRNEGRIEVTALGKTGFICDDKFGMRDAEVVCRELGFSLGALEVRGNSYYAKEISNNTFYLMDDVTCFGNESSLRDCDFNGWGVHNCMAQEVVGVVCKTPEEKCKEGYWQCDSGKECIPLGFLCEGVYDCTDNSDEDDKHCNAPIQLRLANGSTHLEGRVEIKYMDAWGTICDDDFNEDAAKVVCSYFGFDGSASVRKNGYFGPGKGPIWLDQVFCQGNESTVQDCVHWDWGEHNCDHSEDVGVVCSQREAFAGGTERRRQEPVVEPPKVEPLQLLPERCGLRKDSIFTRDDEVHFRVVKGFEAKAGDYPWQASIRVKSKSKPTHWCGAVIISQRFVLTAAHCLQGFSKSSYIIVAGDYHVDQDEGTEQIALIEDFFLHEDFRKVQKMNNDIALVKLKGNGFSITEDVQPICLPDTDTIYESDMNCTISGFGSTKSGRAFYSHTLRAGWIPLQSRDICKMPHIYGSSITDGMICAGFLDEGVDACDGDSGGPLACLHEGVYTLFGITSWGQHCGYANKPGVYVKVAHYRNWIEETMKRYA